MTYLCERKLVRVYFNMVMSPSGKWFRAGSVHGTKSEASSWIPFVKSVWRGCRVKVVQFTMEYLEGKLSDRSKKILDQKFNIEAK